MFYKVTYVKKGVILNDPAPRKGIAYFLDFIYFVLRIQYEKYRNVKKKTIFQRVHIKFLIKFFKLSILEGPKNIQF